MQPMFWRLLKVIEEPNIVWMDIEELKIKRHRLAYKKSEEISIV